MFTPTGRLAFATAVLCLGFGMYGRAEAGIVIETPAGLTPGESFRIVFDTDGTTLANSTSIATYNNFVNAQAGGATYDGVAVTFAAIVSTSSVNAIDNVGQTQTPVFLADGTLVTTSTTSSGLWSGSLLHPIDEDLSGTLQSPLSIWTGTNSSGTAATPLGSAKIGGTDPTLGFSDLTNAEWVDNSHIFNSNTFASEYAISEVLVVAGAVPEPSTLLMTGVGISAVITSGFYSRRRDRRRLRPVGLPDATE
jgi:hypothetical protein